MEGFKTYFVLFYIAACVTPSLQRVTVEILTPSKTGPEVGLIIVPGAYIAGSAYKPVGEAIQADSDLKVWVALLDGFFGNLANPLQLGGAVNKAKAELTKRGAKQVFLAGHSLGGQLTANYVLNHHNGLSGALLFASYLTRNVEPTSYPVPVLTIAGDLDGLVRITRIQESFEQLVADVRKNKNATFRTPVITMEGVNHGQFASGPMPAEVLAYDLEPEVTNVTAYSLIAKYTNAFMGANIPIADSSLIANARKTLTEGYTATGYIMAPLTNMMSVSTNPLHVSKWTSEAQTVLIGLRDTSNVKIVNKVVSERQLLQSTPEMTFEDGVLSITTYTQVAFQSNPLDVSTFYMSPIQLQAEMKSRDAIKAFLPNETYMENNESCVSINQAALQYALGQASPLAVTRYGKKGRPIIYEQDVALPSTQQWFLQELLYEDDRDGVHVTSESYHVPYNSAKASTSGIFFCKLLAPYRAMEWIYVDGLRKLDGIKHLESIFEHDLKIEKNNT
ncbi:uncharacterized protein LOC110461120 isoform X2 [Mizuhopecten yessoensis]|uniref:uncharacterized protein LOC110461120 isoform X1 n=1 Tax=Mizuhopecten yessoensis TaxID=6573 RepID=UPI000B459B77|nr:uncharacterized protein LOC110461120 isoform X1 [Mizuhopecten yessoensis]XP_021370100.1 uncharacterized protein LOC110461120 isoform X2 [Mizuhopecten yessoensis]